MKVRERCICGAEFEMDSYEVLRELRDWREKHRCTVLFPAPINASAPTP